MVRNANILITILLTSTSTLSSATSPQCIAAKNNLDNYAQDATLYKSIQTMWDTFNDKCDIDNSCVFEVEPVAAITHLNFNKLKDSDQYASFERACGELGTEEFPSTVCTVSSKLTVSNGASGTGQITDKFTAKNEPVCFPYQCKENQVDMVHGQPLGCDPEKTDCILEAEDAVCPERPLGAGDGNCHKYSGVHSDNEELMRATNALSSKASMACVSFKKSDEEDAICTSETAPIKVSIAQHIRTFERDSTYKDYLQTCYEKNAETCYMSMSVKMQGPVGFFALDLVADYNDYPACLPAECNSEEKTDMVKELIAADVSQKMNQGMAEGLRRKLVAETGLDIDEEIFMRALEHDDVCPAIGMDVCEFTVMDFYCIERGIETGVMTMGPSDGHINIAAVGLFIASMGVVALVGNL